MTLSPTPGFGGRPDNGSARAQLAASTAVIRPASDQDDLLLLTGYSCSVGRCVLVALVSLVLCVWPAVLLLALWRPVWRLKLTHRRCRLDVASRLLVQDSHNHQCVVAVLQQRVGDGARHLPAEYLSVHESAVDSPVSHNDDDNQPLLVTSHTAAVTTASTMTSSAVHMRCFLFFHRKYVWNFVTRCFERASGLDRQVSVLQLLEQHTGLTRQQQAARLELYGENSIDIEVKSYMSLLIQEVLNPFYIFQTFSVLLWMLDNYYVYAGCIVFVSAVSVGVSLYETRRQSVTLRDMVATSAASQVTVKRENGVAETCDVSCLVPGDVLVLPSGGCTAPCDAVLVAGSAIVNESMLTGESVPVTKGALVPCDDSEMYSPEHHKRCTIFCGTQVIQTRFYGDSPVLAVVVRTGFNTAKGELVRSIMFPKPIGFKFYRDSMKFVGFMALLAAGGMLYTIYLYIIRGASLSRILLRSLDIITVVVPPALPAAMTVGIVYAQNRLKKINIFCTSPPRINVAGKVKLFCFDKTGTLTEDGLSTWGVIGCSSTNGMLATPIRDVTTLNDQSPLKMALASCHGLTRLAGRLIGDPLDIEMFRSTNWELEEPVVTDSRKFDLLAPTVVRPGNGPAHCAATADHHQSVAVQVGIVRQFAFSSSVQRMSVVTRTLGRAHMDLYCKGAPEKIEALCTRVPGNFHSVLHEYTVQGFRVLAVAYKALSRKLQWHHVQRLKRDQVECDMQFCGLLIMQNRLKPESRPVIETLQRADIRCVMVTGDNLLTAVSVGRECGLLSPASVCVIADASPPTAHAPAQLVFYRAAADDHHQLPEDQLQPTAAANDGSGDGQVSVSMAGVFDAPSDYHLVTTGRSWWVIRQHFADMVDRLVVRGAIFARMTPEQKAQLVESLQRLGYTVGMCGDGANDCESLRAADVGVSLSDAEASVAAPFTARSANIGCVPALLREARCALATSFATFKYMALYSIIQFVSVLVLYSRASNLSDTQFLYIDLLITTTVAVTMSYAGAAVRLHKRRPSGSLLSASTLLSILLQVAAVCVCQLLSVWLLELQPWYHAVGVSSGSLSGGRGHGRVLCWENTVVFWVSGYQYLLLATVYSRGPPYRQPFYNNPLFLASLLCLATLQTVLVLVPYAPLASLFGLMTTNAAHSSQFLRRAVLYITCAHTCVAFAIEYVFSGGGVIRSVRGWFNCKRRPKNAYKLVQQQLNASGGSWPPLQRPLLASRPSSRLSVVQQQQQRSQSPQAPS